MLSRCLGGFRANNSSSSNNNKKVEMCKCNSAQDKATLPVGSGRIQSNLDRQTSSSSQSPREETKYDGSGRKEDIITFNQRIHDVLVRIGNTCTDTFTTSPLTDQESEDNEEKMDNSSRETDDLCGSTRQISLEEERIRDEKRNDSPTKITFISAKETMADDDLRFFISASVKCSDEIMKLNPNTIPFFWRSRYDIVHKEIESGSITEDAALDRYAMDETRTSSFLYQGDLSSWITTSDYDATSSPRKITRDDSGLFDLSVSLNSEDYRIPIGSHGSIKKFDTIHETFENKSPDYFHKALQDLTNTKNRKKVIQHKEKRTIVYRSPRRNSRTNTKMDQERVTTFGRAFTDEDNESEHSLPSRGNSTFSSIEVRDNVYSCTSTSPKGNFGSCFSSKFRTPCMSPPSPPSPSTPKPKADVTYISDTSSSEASSKESRPESIHQVLGIKPAITKKKENSNGNEYWIIPTFSQDSENMLIFRSSSDLKINTMKTLTPTSSNEEEEEEKEEVLVVEPEKKEARNIKVPCPESPKSSSSTSQYLVPLSASDNSSTWVQFSDSVFKGSSTSDFPTKQNIKSKEPQHNKLGLIFEI